MFFSHKLPSLCMRSYLVRYSKINLKIVIIFFYILPSVSKLSWGTNSNRKTRLCWNTAITCVWNLCFQNTPPPSTNTNVTVALCHRFVFDTSTSHHMFSHSLFNRKQYSSIAILFRSKFTGNSLCYYIQLLENVYGSLHFN